MTRFHFDRPDGEPDGELIQIHLNEFIPPQGLAAAIALLNLMLYEDGIRMSYEDLTLMRYE